MEHILHLFGGGCGEHLIWPWVAGIGSGVAMWISSIKDAGKEAARLADLIFSNFLKWLAVSTIVFLLMDQM